MNQMNTPEAILTKVSEFTRSGDEEHASRIIYEFLNSSKKKTWSSPMESLILLFIELCIKLNKIKYLKEGLSFYRSLTQVSNIGSFILVLTKTKEFVEEKFTKALKKFQGINIDLADLDEEDTYLFFEEASESKEKEYLVLSQKFIWDTYKILLDITKTNSKLFSLYAQILKASFIFCRENKRTVEFKRLCDSVRNYLHTLIKSEKRQNFLNKVQISHLDVLKILIQMRLNQIETATELEQWLESFKTAEDIVYLIEKYEKHALEQDKSKKGTGERTKKSKKLNPLLKLEFYSNIEKLFWISNYPLYHSFANLLIRNIGLKSKALLLDKKDQMRKFNLGTIDDRIILSSLATPLKNAYTNYIKIGEDMFEEENGVEVETCKRMMAILKLSYTPSRNALINAIENLHIDQSCCEEIRLLYHLFQKEQNPIILCKKAVELLGKIKDNPLYQRYSEKIIQNIVIKALMLFSSMYDSISIKRLTSLLTPLGIDEIQLGDIICETSRIGLVKSQTDRVKQLIMFKIPSNIKESLQVNLSNFLEKLKPVFNEVNQKVNAMKYNKIRTWIYQEIRKKNNESLHTTEQTLREIKEKTQTLKKYLSDKNAVQGELREKSQNEKEEQRILQIEKEKLEKDELKNAQKKKEYDIQVKKYVIDNLRRYTNAIIVDGKRIKLDDLLKDLNKVTEEEIIKSLENQEKESKTKKEKKLILVTKTADYLIREFRTRDNKVFKEYLEKKEKEFNDNSLKESKEYYDEKIGIKAALTKFKKYKDDYFANLTRVNKEKYEQEMIEFKTKLEEQVAADLYNELNVGFKKYYEEFKKKESEDESKKRSTGTWQRKNENKPFERSKNFEDNRPPGEIVFRRAANVAVATEKEKPLTFIKGSKLADNKETINLDSNKDKSTIKGEITFNRSGKAEQIPEKIGKPLTFNRAGKVEQIPEKTDKPLTFNRAGKTETLKDIETKKIEKETPKGGNVTTAKDKDRDKGSFARGTKVAIAKDKEKESEKKPGSFVRASNFQPKNKQYFN